MNSHKCYVCKLPIADDHLLGINKAKNGRTVYFCDRVPCAEKYDEVLGTKDRQIVQSALGNLLDMQQEVPQSSPGDNPERIMIKRPKLNIVYINHKDNG